MCLFASIHQPNNDLFNLFDNIYVLAKEGVNVYSGKPLDLRQYLFSVEIEINENNIPIEILLDIASDETNMKLIETSLNKKELNSKYLSQEFSENMRSVYGKQTISKRFSFKDIYYLMIRLMNHSYRYQWKSLLLQIIIYQLMALIMKSHFNPDMIKPSGCMSFDEIQCEQTLDTIYETKLIKMNIRYIISLTTFISFVILNVTSTEFAFHYQMCRKEQRNGNIISYSYIILGKIKIN